MAPNEEQERADLKIPGDHPPHPPPPTPPKKTKNKTKQKKQTKTNKIRAMCKSKPTSNKCL